MGTKWQAALQVSRETSASVMQGSPSEQETGQAPSPLAMPVSQVSPGSTCLLPQEAEQSGSSSAVQPAGQQPSFWAARQAVTGLTTQRAEQSSLRPSRRRAMQPPGSSGQAVGQAPSLPAAMALSQASPASTTELPQRAGQSESTLRLPPAGQQPSSLL